MAFDAADAAIDAHDAAAASLRAVLQLEVQRPPAREIDILVLALLARFGSAVRAVLFYGSCRRGVGLRDGIVDFWVLVEDRRACESGWRARLGGWLPPNVYYLETQDDQGPLRAKVALFTLPELERGARAYETYVWGRLAQPVSIVYAATPAEHAAVLAVLARSVEKFLDASLPLAGQMTVSEAWRSGLQRSYSTELRAEGGGRAADIVELDRAHYEALLVAARPLALWIDAEGTARVRSLPEADIAAARRTWRGRARVGKARSVLRLLKGLYTFDGGFDYIAWKLSRHAGREVVIPERVRRWPWLFVWGLMWKLYRQGVFR